MKLTTRTAGDATVLKVVGSVLSAENQVFAGKLAELRTSGVLRVIVDAEELEYINSQGIADLMVFYSRIHEAGGKLALAGLQPMTEKVVRAVGLSELVELYATAAEAEETWSA
jgi:anti-sigma B factor antagonist